jgi:hypothetical protein
MHAWCPYQVGPEVLIWAGLPFNPKYCENLLGRTSFKYSVEGVGALVEPPCMALVHGLKATTASLLSQKIAPLKQVLTVLL